MVAVACPSSIFRTASAARPEQSSDLVHTAVHSIAVAAVAAAVAAAVGVSAGQDVVDRMSC